MTPTESVDHHFVRLTDNELSFILDFDPDDLGPEVRLDAYRRWANTVKDAVENGLETW